MSVTETELTHVKHEHIDTFDSDDDKIVINVGGQRHVTLTSTLLKKPGTRLWHLVMRNNGSGNRNREFFFDRHPGVFSSVIDYYRTGESDIIDFVLLALWHFDTHWVTGAPQELAYELTRFHRVAGKSRLACTQQTHCGMHASISSHIPPSRQSGLCPSRERSLASRQGYKRTYTDQFQHFWNGYGSQIVNKNIGYVVLIYLYCLRLIGRYNTEYKFSNCCVLI